MPNFLVLVDGPNSLVVLLSNGGNLCLPRLSVPVVDRGIPGEDQTVTVDTNNVLVVIDGNVGKQADNLVPAAVNASTSKDFVGGVDAPHSAVLSNRDVDGSPINLGPVGTVPVEDFLLPVNAPHVVTGVNGNVSQSTRNLVPVMAVPFENLVRRVDNPRGVLLSNADLNSLTRALSPLRVI